MAAIALMALAGFLVVRFFSQSDGVSERAFFYDLSEQKLFTALRTAVPPIRGVNDDTLDGVRAVVFSTSGRPEDKKSWKIAYLEKYTPELKAQMEEAQKTGASPQISRGMSMEFRLVRRVDEDRWYPMTTPEAERIVSEWANPGPDGVTPVVCSP